MWPSWAQIYKFPHSQIKCQFCQAFATPWHRACPDPSQRIHPPAPPLRRSRSFSRLRPAFSCSGLQWPRARLLPVNALPRPARCRCSLPLQLLLFLRVSSCLSPVLVCLLLKAPGVAKPLHLFSCLLNFDTYMTIEVIG